MQGSKVSEKALESFSSRIANWIIAGELAIGDWSPAKGTEIKVSWEIRRVQSINLHWTHQGWILTVAD
jgi:hypothetical protein